MNCPRCVEPMKLVVEVLGGCCGRDRCYCNDPDVRVVYKCRNRVFRCKQPEITIPELSCRNSIQRWMEKNYE